MKKITPHKIWKYVRSQAVSRPNVESVKADVRFGTDYGIDRVIAISGFGAFVTGWLVFPKLPVIDMSLSVNGEILVEDRKCHVSVARPDLSNIITADYVWTAGFYAVFRGNLPESQEIKLNIHINFDEGRTLILDVPSDSFYYCDKYSKLTTIANLFPSIENEDYLLEFTRLLSNTVKHRANGIVNILFSKCSDVVIISLPRNWDDTFLIMANICEKVNISKDFGIAILMDRHHSRTRVLDRLSFLQRVFKQRVSLFEVSEPTYALWSLEPVLSALGAERFWFCGPEVVPTEVGWHAAVSYFAEERSMLELFVRERRASALPEPESLSFAWTSRDFTAWAADAPFFLGGFHRDNHLPAAPPPARHHGAIGLLRTMVGSEPIRRADERLYAAFGARDQIEAGP